MKKSVLPGKKKKKTLLNLKFFTDFRGFEFRHISGNRKLTYEENILASFKKLTPWSYVYFTSPNKCPL